RPTSRRCRRVLARRPPAAATTGSGGGPALPRRHGPAGDRGVDGLRRGNRQGPSPRSESNAQHPVRHHGGPPTMTRRFDDLARDAADAVRDSTDRIEVGGGADDVRRRANRRVLAPVAAGVVVLAALAVPTIGWL